MRIVSITAGAAGMYCGSCMRDNTLASALIELGHEALLVPTFTPIRTDEADVSSHNVFLGGINVYLQDRFRLFRHTPRFLDALLNRRWLLKLAGRFSSQTDYSTLGGMTASMLQGDHGRQRKEVAKLVDWLSTDISPDVVLLTNALLSGVVPSIRRSLRVPVFTTLQGDDVFLDALPTADRERCIALIRSHDADTAGYISTSSAYADRMSTYLGIDRSKIHVIYPGINSTGHLAQFVDARPDRPPTVGAASGSHPPPTVGYFARIAPEKGFDALIDAFLFLRQLPGMADVRLRYSGWLGEQHRPFHNRQIAKLTQAGAAASVERVDCPNHDSKVKFMQSIDVLSVPTAFHEPKGLYVLEAWANGVPVVLPRRGSFPELVESTGAGLLVTPDDPTALATGIHQLLIDEPRRLEFGRRGWQAVRDRFTARQMAINTIKLLEKFTVRQSGNNKIVAVAELKS